MLRGERNAAVCLGIGLSLGGVGEGQVERRPRCDLPPRGLHHLFPPGAPPTIFDVQREPGRIAYRHAAP